jgi:hypothetical protein
MNQRKTILARIIILFVTVVLVILPGMEASAALRKCRTDPIFHLSNGEKLTVILEIEADKKSVKDVHYVLHLPAGVRILRVVYTAGGIGESETYEVVNDNPEATYTTETLVNTYQEKVFLTAITTLNANRSGSVSGYSGDLLVVNLVQTQQKLSELSLELNAAPK